MTTSALNKWLVHTRRSLPLGSTLSWETDEWTGTLWIDQLRLPRHARKGAGSVLLAKILEQADRAGVAVELNADPTDEPGDPGLLDLVGWYMRFGFERLSADDDGVQMRRARQPAKPWTKILDQAKAAPRADKGELGRWYSEQTATPAQAKPSPGLRPRRV